MCSFIRIEFRVKFVALPGITLMRVDPPSWRGECAIDATCDLTGIGSNTPFLGLESSYSAGDNSIDWSPGLEAIGYWLCCFCCSVVFISSGGVFSARGSDTGGGRDTVYEVWPDVMLLYYEVASKFCRSVASSIGLLPFDALYGCPSIYLILCLWFVAGMKLRSLCSFN